MLANQVISRYAPVDQRGCYQASSGATRSERSRRINSWIVKVTMRVVEESDDRLRR